MKQESVDNDTLESITKEKDALDQSMALNRVVLAMLDSKRKEDFWLRLVLIISILINLAIVGIFVWYENQWEYTTTTTTTVTQDTGEGSGNNVYQAGENADYIQGGSEGVESDGKANNNNYTDNYKDKSIE